MANTIKAGKDEGLKQAVGEEKAEVLNTFIDAEGETTKEKF